MKALAVRAGSVLATQHAVGDRRAVGLLILITAIAAPLLAPRGPAQADFRRMNKPPGRAEPPGTDSRARHAESGDLRRPHSLFRRLSAVILGTTVGSLWGSRAANLRGRFDLVSQRIMEIMQAFPDLILAMAISMAIGPVCKP